MAKINRRSFLGATIGSVLGASGLFAGEAFAKPIPVPKHWDRTVDVLVVGSGFSGLSAAIEARTNGADVLCIEKMAMIGGNSVLSAGALPHLATICRLLQASRTAGIAAQGHAEIGRQPQQRRVRKGGCLRCT